MVDRTSLICPKNERQRSINDFWSRIMDNPRAVRWHEAIGTLSAAFLRKNSCDYIAATS